jgi:hypothetical protein
MHPGIRQLVETEWSPEDQISDGDLAKWVHEILSAEDADDRFAIEVVVPADSVTLGFTARSLASITRRLQISLLLAFLEPEQVATFEDTRALLREFKEIPLRVTALTISSVKVTVEGEPEEVAKILGQQKPPRHWRRKLMAILAAMAAGAGITVMIENHTAIIEAKLPTTQEVRKEVDRTCGFLPKGTVIKLKTGILEIEVPCGGEPPKS